MNILLIKSLNYENVACLCPTIFLGNILLYIVNITWWWLSGYCTLPDRSPNLTRWKTYGFILMETSRSMGVRNTEWIYLWIKSMILSWGQLTHLKAVLEFSCLEMIQQSVCKRYWHPERSFTLWVNLDDRDNFGTSKNIL